MGQVQENLGGESESLAEAGIQPNGTPEKQPSSVLPTALALIGFVVIGWTMMRAARKKGRSRRSSDQGEDPRERLNRIRESAQKRSAEAYEAEATELTRTLAAQLDAKAQALEELIARADERLARLQGVSGEVLPSKDLQQPASFDGGDATRRDVFRLADEGLDPLEIAQKLQQPVGQVRLMLALRRA